MPASDKIKVLNKLAKKGKASTTQLALSLFGLLLYFIAAYRSLFYPQTIKLLPQGVLAILGELHYSWGKFVIRLISTHFDINSLKTYKTIRILVVL